MQPPTSPGPRSGIAPLRWPPGPGTIYLGLFLVLSLLLVLGSRGLPGRRSFPDCPEAGWRDAVLASDPCPRVRGALSAADDADPVLALPRSFRDLLALSPDRLAGLDIARLNLLSAEGLPGSELLTIEQACAILELWARRVEHETSLQWHQFEQAPAEFHHSEAYFRALALVTVLQQDCGVHYRTSAGPSARPAASQDPFLHGLLRGAREGTCASMPVLYVAVGRRLGYPLKLVTAKGHLFARWEASGERWNLEATGQGLNCFPDTYYHDWPEPMTAAERGPGGYLESLDAAGEWAVFLSARGHALEVLGRQPEAHFAHALAHALAPRHPDYLAFLAGAVAKAMPAWRQVHIDLGESAPATYERLPGL